MVAQHGGLFRKKHQVEIQLEFRESPEDFLNSDMFGKQPAQEIPGNAGSLGGNAMGSNLNQPHYPDEVRLRGGNFIGRDREQNGGSDLLNSIEFSMEFGEGARQLRSFVDYGASANDVEKILADGKFLHRNGSTYKNGYHGGRWHNTSAIKSTFQSSAKFLKGAGKAIGVVNIAITGYQTYDDVSNGNYYSAGARAFVAGAAAGAVFIPVVGWGIAIGIGVSDAIWGDQFYEYVENQFQ